MICMMFYNQQITKLPHDVEVHFTMGLRSLWEWIEALVFTCWEERCSWYRACLRGAYTGMRGARFDDQIGGEGVLDGALTREPASSCSPRDGASKGSDDEFSVGTMEVMGNELGRSSLG